MIRLISVIVSLIFIVYFGLDRLSFVKNAVTTNGTVLSLNAENYSARKGGKYSHREPRTRFKAAVSYSTANGDYQTTCPAGSVHGHNQPVSRAKYSVGSPVKILYNRKNPQIAYADEFFEIWGVCFIPGAFFIASLLRSGRRKEQY